MAELFHIADGGVGVLRPVSFRQNHTEENLQRWVDDYPHLLNAGTPMLSLGTEIETRHGHYIDNLFVDGNGCLVVAELKRGPAPRDVTAQLIDYAAYASRLEWPDVDELCRKRHEGTSLDDAYMRCFGRPLVRVEKIDLRLLIVAERYEPSVSDAALFLINSGTPLALLEFTYFEVGDSKLIEVRTVLGEVPEQIAASAYEAPATPEDGRLNWVLASVAERLPEIAQRHGWVLKHVVNKQSLPIVSARWPTKLSQCQLVLVLWSRDKLNFRLTYREDDLPGLRDMLDGRRDDWHEAFPAEFANPPYELVFANLGYDVPIPEMRDTGALADVVKRTERMAEAMVPLLDEYFAGQLAGGT